MYYLYGVIYIISNLSSAHCCMSSVSLVLIDIDHDSHTVAIYIADNVLPYITRAVKPVEKQSNRSVPVLCLKNKAYFLAQSGLQILQGGECESRSANKNIAGDNTWMPTYVLPLSFI